MRYFRKPGISTLIACQNEEAIVGLSIISFIPFSDEIIVVDNGSTDRTIEICREVESIYPSKVKFFSVPNLKDLSENRAFALEKSQFQWVVRADADYVCYTDGKYDCRNLRTHLLSRKIPPMPLAYCLIQPNVYGDFWHSGDSGKESLESRYNKDAGLYQKPLWRVSPAMPRIYRVFPGFRFMRLGRWEGARFSRFMHQIYWPDPIWMHCNVKSDLNYFYRSERTNWRELGDYRSFPSLESYIKEVIAEKYGTDDIVEAKKKYMEYCFCPNLIKYDPEKAYPYPGMLKRVMGEYPVYKIEKTRKGLKRYYSGPIEPKNISLV